MTRASTPGAAPGEAPDIAAQVVANIRAQPLGPNNSAAVLNLPNDFLRHVADRILRLSYCRAFRSVQAMPEPAGLTPPPPPKEPASVEVRRREVSPERLAMWNSFSVEPPQIRSFRAPVDVNASDAMPMRIADAKYSEAEARAADFVAKRLAFDGLLPTLTRAIDLLGAREWVSPTPYQLRRLDAIGIPTDLIASFEVPDIADRTPAAIAGRIASKLDAGAIADDLAKELAAVPFRFKPTAPGFRIANESGERTIESIRLHVNADRMIGGLGAGGTLDMTRQLLAAMPNARFFIHARESNVDPLVKQLGGWAVGAPGRVIVSAEPLPIAQWSQDNAKPGFIEADGQRTATTIMPRYTGRGEPLLNFMAGESSALESFANLGQRLVQSPLIFEGGDVIAAWAPQLQRRILFVGEAEIARNVALGLTPDQARQAFAEEFGVHRVEVLPAASFHIDFEVSFRVFNDKLTAFVVDTRAGVRNVLTAATQALARANRLKADDAKKMEDLLARDEFHDPILILSETLGAGVGPSGMTADFAKLFAADSADWGGENLRRVLLAIDLAMALYEQNLPDTLNAQTTLYFEALKRNEQTRLGLREQLIKLNIPVSLVAGISADGLSIGGVNMLHAPGLCLMPAWGGMFSEFDRALQGSMKAALGPGVDVVLIRSAETLQREGGPHCVASFHPSAP